MKNKTVSIPGYLATSLYGSVGTPVNTTTDYLQNLFKNNDDVKKIDSN